VPERDGRSQEAGGCARAAHVERVRMLDTRLAPAALEPRAAIGQWDAARGRYTLIAGTQGVAVVRRMLAEFVFKVPPAQVRVLTYDVGRNRTVGCCIELSAEIFTPGRVQRNTSHTGTWFAVGELDGYYTPRVKEVQSILAHVARCDVTNNIYGAKWTKLIANTMTMGPHGLLGLRNAEAVALPGIAEIAIRIGQESLAVGAALGFRTEAIFGLRADEFAGSNEENLVTARQTLMKHVGGRSRTAPIHDHIKGRRSEMEFISGLVSRKGQELGIPTPGNDAVTEIDRQINDGSLRMDRSNLELLKARIEEKASRSIVREAGDGENRS